MAEMKEGAWYWCLVCRDCREPMPMYEVTSEYVHPSDEAGQLLVTCPYCGAEGQYDMRDGVRLQAAPGDQGPGSTIH
jgi:RNase P subunit RPR2